MFFRRRVVDMTLEDCRSVSVQCGLRAGHVIDMSWHVFSRSSVCARTELGQTGQIAGGVMNCLRLSSVCVRHVMALSNICDGTVWTSHGMTPLCHRYVIAMSSLCVRRVLDLSPDKAILLLDVS